LKFVVGLSTKLSSDTVDPAATNRLEPDEIDTPWLWLSDPLNKGSRRSKKSFFIMKALKVRRII